MASIFDKVWRWVWNTETKYYDGQITRDTDWGGDASTENQPVSGGRVQEWLKNEINGKFGVIRMSATINEQNFYSLEMFSTKEDEQLYDEDNEKYEGLVTRVTIPISTVQGDSFTAFLSTTLPQNDIVVSDGELKVLFNYRAIRYTQGVANNEGALGTLIVQTSRDNGSTWKEAGREENVLKSKEPNDTESVDEVFLGKYLESGKQMIRVRATYAYEDIASGEIKQMNSPWVNVGASVTKTKLEIELMTPFHTPMYAINEETKDYNNFNVNYRVYGSVKKTMYVVVEGSLDTITEELYDITADGDTQGISLPYSDKYGFHTHGVRKVKAWLECEDGLGGIIKSNELNNQFMMVADESNTQKYLLLQNVKETVTNYIQSTLAEYAVYSPDESQTDLSFQIQDTRGYVYTEVASKVNASDSETLKMSIDIEPTDEGNVPDGYRTRFYVFNGQDNLILSSGLDEDGYYDVYVDNKNAVIPVLGATFLMNPKNRDNSETTRDKIYNEKANNLEVSSEFKNFGFINDGWMTAEDGQKVLRVMAGSTLTIHRNVWAQYFNKSNNDSALTFEIDFRVSNVTNTDSPILQMKGGTGNKGLILNPLIGWIRSASYNNDDNCMFAWREGERQFLSLNIHNNIKPIGNDCIYPSNMSDTANGSIALARVLLNGDAVREIPFDRTKGNEWCDDEGAAIVIGNEGADIDIYSIRIYENKQVDWVDLLMKNYPSSLPTTKEKQDFIERNSIRSGRYISLTEAQKRGLNCIVYHGTRPYIHANADQKQGWVEYFRYDQDGNPLPEYSGTNCKNSNALGWKSQGTTAKTYYEHNIQDDNSKTEYNFASGAGVIRIPLDSLHESISVASEPYQGVIDEDADKGGKYEGIVIDLYGGNLGKNFPLEMKGKPYPYSNGYVTVPDGWIDGNGKYRGLGYQVSEGTALAQKKVAKINYASAMQSHLIGACNSYDDLHFLCVGATPLQQQYIDRGLTRPVLAKHTEPFLMFWDNGNGETYYTGLCVYGAGKMDKVAWGWVKKLHPMFSLIEGSDNNLPLTDFRVPFDDSVSYDAKEEGWVYANQQSWDFDAGVTDDNDVPDNSIRKHWAKYHNFVYLNSTNIMVYDGSVDEFLLSQDATNNIKYKYWCTEGDKAFHLLRYDFANKEWVDAGLKDSTGKYSVVDLKTDIRTKNTYESFKSSSAWDKINTAFKEDMAKFFKENGKFLMSQKSLLFNYSYVLTFLAGTDNSSKNTYFQTDPIAQDMSSEASDSFSAWHQSVFGESFDYQHVYLMYMGGDDMDSILPVNNKGNLTKPYYIERLYPFADGSNVCLYEGMDNALFNLVEAAFTQDERSAMMNTILTNAQFLVEEEDNLLALKDNKVSVWGFLHKYFFNVQYYFPKICYLEQARIRYEFAEVMGHLGRDSVRPISQSIGSNVENEMQFMNQRLVYMASFAVFGALGNGVGNVGLTEATDRFSFSGAAMPDGSPSSYTFTITPHQYLYPCGFNGSTTIPSKKRTSQKQTCTFTIADGITGDTDTVLGIRGINYISDLGNLGDKRITSDLTINGKRLKVINASFTANSTFNPSSIKFQANNIATIYLAPSASLYIDMSSLIRLRSLEYGGGIKEVVYPKTSTLIRLVVLTRSATVSLDYAPNLSEFRISSSLHSSVKILKLGSSVGTNVEGFTVQPIVESIWNSQKSQASPALQTIHVENVDWKDFDVNALSWFADRPVCEFKGTIAIKDTDEYRPAVTWDLKNKFNEKFGNVDNKSSSTHKGLLLEYVKRDLKSAHIKGNFYVEAGNTFKFSLVPDSIYVNTQIIWNWSVEGDANVSIDNNGVLTVWALSDTVKTTKVKNHVWFIDKDLIFEKTIEIWNRPAQVGDFVYADGTFSSVESYDGDKTPIGRCFYVAPRKADGTINEKYHNPNDKMTRLMVSCDDITASSDTESFTIWQWGAYNNNDNYSIFETLSDGTKKVLSIDGGVTTIYDVPNLRNLSNSGLKLPNGTSASNITEETFRDSSDEGLENDGFKAIAANYSMGDGFAYNESTIYLNERKLDDVLLQLAGSGYSKGDIVNSGYAKTLRVIAHRNNILRTGLEQVGLEPDRTHFHIPTGDNELYELAKCISAIRVWAKSEEGLNDIQYGDKWSQLYYPVISACYAYEPKDLKEGEILNPKFGKHNWFSPTAGLLARLCYYTYDHSSGSAVVRENSPMDTITDSKGKILFKIITTSPLWSVTEVNGTFSWDIYFSNGATNYSYKRSISVGRAVCAF